ncbi:MAG TPA: hypothetical protein EYN13_06430 [Methylococcales bacterium]|nr:hypothetical protein [Methylococcales bacterium]
MINKCIKYKMVGVDVSKLKLNITCNQKRHLTIDNQESKFSKLIQSVADLNNVCFVMEATGGYERKPS